MGMHGSRAAATRARTAAELSPGPLAVISVVFRRGPSTGKSMRSGCDVEFNRRVRLDPMRLAESGVFSDITLHNGGFRPFGQSDTRGRSRQELATKTRVQPNGWARSYGHGETARFLKKPGLDPGFLRDTENFMENPCG